MADSNFVGYSTTGTTGGSCPCCGQYTWATNNVYVAQPTYLEKAEMIKALGEMFFNQMSDDLKTTIEKKIRDIIATV